MADTALNRAIFAEPDDERLLSRLRAVAGSDLSSDQVARLAAGDVSVVQDLSLSVQQGVRALVVPNSAGAGVLESMVGVSLDYVPVAYLDLARMASNAVGRVVDAKRKGMGTGTMVSERLFLTNNHVIPGAVDPKEALLQLDYELGVDGTPIAPTEFRFDPDVFFWTSTTDEFDATIIAVGKRVSGKRTLASFGTCALSGARDKHAEGDFVTIVQHPEGDYKQIALRENRVVGRGKGGVTLHYGADTLPGSSGSPVFNDQFELVALHHAGGPLNDTVLDTDQAVPAESNEGIRISALVKALRDALDDMADRFRRLLAEALDPPSTGPRPTRRRGRAETLEEDSDESAIEPIADGPLDGWTTAAMTVPLVVGVRSHAARAEEQETDASAPVAGLGMFERNEAPDERYDKRRGYVADFLGPTVELPKLSASQLKRAAVVGKRIAANAVLNYWHFSAVIDATRRMPFFTAVNIDGKRARGINRKTGEVEASETWFEDPRIQPDEQLDQALFDNRPRIFDRGHMVRRLDPAWGSPAMAKRSADDTFHFTNCCPQISAFNQRVKLWAGIENYVLDNAKAERERITIFTGPLFAKADPDYHGVNIPRAFWKLLVRIDGGAMRCTAFLADQSDLLDKALAAAGIEAFDELGRVAEFQISVDQLTEDTGLDFGPLADHDTLALEAAALPIRSIEDAKL